MVGFIQFIAVCSMRCQDQMGFIQTLRRTRQQKTHATHTQTHQPVSSGPLPKHPNQECGKALSQTETFFGLVKTERILLSLFLSTYQGPLTAPGLPDLGQMLPCPHVLHLSKELFPGKKNNQGLHLLSAEPVAFVNTPLELFYPSNPQHPQRPRR